MIEIRLDFFDITEKRPAYGVPVLIATGDIVQEITYVLDGADGFEDWFKPCHFEDEEDLTILFHKVSKWAYLPEIV